MIFVKISSLRNLSQTSPAQFFPADKQAAYQHLRELGIDPGLMYQELEMDSSYVNTHRDTSYSNEVLHLHSHSFYELLYCRSAGQVEYLVGAERYRLEKGDLIFIAPHVSHRPLFPETMPEPYVRDVLWINADFMDQCIQAFLPEGPLMPPGAALLRTAGTRWESLDNLFREGIWEAETRQPGWEGAVAANTMSILVQLHRAAADSSPQKAEQPELLDQAIAYVERNLARKITLSDTARQLYVSESTVSQTFRRKMDVSFYRYVTQRRLIAAKTLIRQDLPLEGIPEQVGFSDYSSFFRAFKQEYGIGPRQYRQLQSVSAAELP